MTKPSDGRPGIFWTWQDAQLHEEDRIEREIADIAAHGFGTVLVQPRGCRYPLDDPLFVERVVAATERAHASDMRLWLHLDPRSASRSILAAGGDAARYLIVAGEDDDPRRNPRTKPGERRIDVETGVRPDGRFDLRLAYPAIRPYHVHSDGALRFRPLRLARLFAFQRDPAGVVRTRTVHDATRFGRLFVNELSGYVEVFGRWDPPEAGEWRVLALVEFASNYPDYASAGTRKALERTLERYAEAGARLDGIWWDEPGYCTAFDRTFRADRGRIPVSPALAELHAARTGRDPGGDLLHLLAEIDDGAWGERREDYYRTLETAVFGAQRALVERARELFGPHLGSGVHQTWHQNADDILNGCGDWWRGARWTSGGFTDVGDAERVEDPGQMAEVVAFIDIAVSLARRAERPHAYINLWGVAYGEEGVTPDAGVLDWWVDLMGAFGCRWLAHTYGPTGYFERPSVWGPGYPHHPTWAAMRATGERLRTAIELAEEELPEADTALVYPLGSQYRLGSDLGNPLARGVHRLIRILRLHGFELDVIAPHLLADAPPDRYRNVIYLHPFGAKPEDVGHLERMSEAGARVVAAGLPPVDGHGYAAATAWRPLLGAAPLDVAWPDLLRARQSRWIEGPAGARWRYLGLPGWGRPTWTTASEATARWRADGAAVASGAEGATLLGFFLEGMGEGAIRLLHQLGVRPTWETPPGAFATRTRLPGGATLLRACPGRYGSPISGTFRLADARIEVRDCHGLLALCVTEDGRVREHLAPPGARWRSVPESET